MFIATEPRLKTSSVRSEMFFDMTLLAELQIKSRQFGL